MAEPVICRIPVVYLVNLSAAELAILESGSQRLGLFIRLAVDPVLRCWLGVGPINVGVNVLDPSGAAYSGFGAILDLPAFDQLINGAAARVELQLSGLNDQILALASFSDVVKGKSCDIGFGLFDKTWALVGPVHWMRHYIADYLAMNVTPAGDASGQTIKTATLSIGSSMTGRRRRGLSYFNNQDQQARSPTDRFCERTPLYSQLGNKTWPRYI